jgi:hypothetical protein
MHAPEQHNLTIYQGATFEHTTTCLENDEPRDLTGYTARMQARADAAAQPILDLTTGDGITLGGTTGTITIEIPAADTAGLPPGDWRYDLQITDGTRVDRCYQGTITIDAAITQTPTT